MAWRGTATKPINVFAAEHNSMLTARPAFVKANEEVGMLAPSPPEVPYANSPSRYMYHTVKTFMFYKFPVPRHSFPGLYSQGPRRGLPQREKKGNTCSRDRRMNW
ncbi:hypothetical protein MCOR07_006180 [Pyricularia oryzae]|uniref:Uncharacterized protein n=1 Tax=Pyricularia oryzae TaxID=318829 RepID=A0A4P7NRM3_PYROR|nr:hypothetical protein MCOR19_009240 [Pyricularia oryzae]KAI6355845.1 hypothetical protein MCOR32_010117 [Pyricularia oryzae]KAI6445769.1 hypothetical protein MCOR22_004100 [Pyricularia oryzae]KAI6474757.1 hypothetical protein MCOR18_007726 [Pyricularia oryzae]KAI6488911.1 hypothetical protein MCOR11_008165 [Pyricularia oryzae]